MPVTAAQNDEIAQLISDTKEEITKVSAKLGRLNELHQNLIDVYSESYLEFDPDFPHDRDKAVPKNRKVMDSKLGIEMEDGRRVKLINAYKIQAQNELP